MRRVLAVVLLASVVAACGGEDSPTTTAVAGPFPEDAFAFVASSDLAVGHERLLVAVSDPRGTRLPKPDIPVTFTIWRQGQDHMKQVIPAEFIWAIPDVSGLYKAWVDFDASGIWMVSVQPEGAAAPLTDFAVQVAEFPITVGVGEPAPPSDTPTIADHPDLAEISTATDPNPAFYQSSIADAVASGRPSVIAFATPKFCQTAICGPTLDVLETLLPSYPGVNFLHVEVFTNLDDPQNLATVPAVAEWGLPTEPWVFVVDADGVVIGRFEGVVDPDDLAELLG